MKTKDEILDWALMQDGGVGYVSKAMDEWARQRVIEFNKWTMTIDCPYSSIGDDKWTNVETDEDITTAKLYRIFENQNK